MRSLRKGASYFPRPCSSLLAIKGIFRKRGNIGKRQITERKRMEDTLLMECGLEETLPELLHAKKAGYKLSWEDCGLGPLKYLEP